ncbi:MAG: hypothetical protein M3217_10745 [Actinomycetota bacterium]|nr:hypothetical protein [Actinomycetota bacterium]
MGTSKRRFGAGFVGLAVLSLFAASLWTTGLASAGEGRPSPGATPGSGGEPGQSGEEHGQGHAYGNGNPNGKDEDGDGQVDEIGEQGHIDTLPQFSTVGVGTPVTDPVRGLPHFGTANPCQPHCMPSDTPTPPCKTTNQNATAPSVHFFYAHYSDEVSYYQDVVGANNAQGLAEVVDRINYAIFRSEPPGFRQRIRMHCTIGTNVAGQSALPADRVTPVVLTTNSTPGCPAFSFCAMVRDLSALGYNKPNKAYFVFLDSGRNGGNAMGSQAHVCNWYGAGPCYGVATGSWRSVAEHEFVHLLGAPHTTGECTGVGDTADVMWYWWEWWRVDYGGDDYYNTYNGWDPSFHCGLHNGWSIGGWNAVRSHWLEYAG